MNVFKLQEIREHPETLKSVPVMEEDCNLCMECVAKCRERAIRIEEGG